MTEESNTVDEICDEIDEYVSGKADFHTNFIEVEDVPVEVWTLASYDSNVPNSEVVVTIGFDESLDDQKEARYYSSLRLTESQWRKLSNEIEEIIKMLKDDVE